MGENYKKLVTEFSEEEKKWSVPAGTYLILNVDIHGSRTKTYKQVKRYAAQTRLVHICTSKNEPSLHHVTVVFHSSDKDQPIIPIVLTSYAELKELTESAITPVSALSIDLEVKVLVYINYHIYNHMKEVAKHYNIEGEKLSEVVMTDEWSQLRNRDRYGSIFTTTTSVVEEKNELIELKDITKALNTYMVNIENES